MSNPEVKALVAAGVTSAATALGLPPLVVPALVDLFETLAGAPDILEAIARARQNALADAEDAAAVAAANLVLKRGH